MCVACVAIIENPKERGDFCAEVRGIGGECQMAGDVVCTKYIGDDQKAEKLIELFERYSRHEIHVYQS